MRRRFRDVVVILPGITGSILKRDGRTIWAPSHRLGLSAAVSPANAADDLLLRDGDDSEVCATAVMPDAHMLGGLVKIDGYSSLVDSIERNFLVVRASAGDTRPANLLEFPYDWRLDNRVNARRLQEVVTPALDRWRQYADAPDARVILVAHSMGGLIARYFLEVLGGWRDCRALVTFGTPFRGSLDALGYLANGYKKLHLDLTRAMRSFPSVYQLLPIYPALRTPAGYRRVAEGEPVPNVDPARAADALSFHREIEASVAENDREAPQRYALLPVVGTHQPTHQSATLRAGAVRLSRQLPDGVDQFLAEEGIEGDGTVPMCSAMPIDMSDIYSDMYLAGKHGSLQNSGYLLGDLMGKLAKMQATGLGKLRGPDTRAAMQRSALSVDVDDEFRWDEPIEIRVSSLPHRAGLDEVRVDLETVGTGEVRQIQLKRSADIWGATVGPLSVGTYRYSIAGSGSGDVPTAVSDLLQVSGP